MEDQGISEDRCFFSVILCSQMGIVAYPSVSFCSIARHGRLFMIPYIFIHASLLLNISDFEIDVYCSITTRTPKRPNLYLCEMWKSACYRWRKVV